MYFQNRFKVALQATLWHLTGTLFFAAFAATLVFGLWYPYPYREFSGGSDLFKLIIAVDIISGPLLTLILFSPFKPRRELWRDLTLVAMLQLSALGYGVWSVWQARPLFLVAEIDRFKVIAKPDLADFSKESLPAEIQPALFAGPVTVGIRAPKDAAEKQAVLFASALGGADYGERPGFYIPYDATTALKSLQHARPLMPFLQKIPALHPHAKAMADAANTPLESLHYLPVIARQDWIALLDAKGMVVGFLKGDGFAP